MKLEKMINGKRVIDVSRFDSISIYEVEDETCLPIDEEHSCVQYIVNEATNEVLFELQSDTPISVGIKL